MWIIFHYHTSIFKIIFKEPFIKNCIISFLINFAIKSQDGELSFLIFVNWSSVLTLGWYLIFLVKKAPVLSALGTVLILPPPDQTQDPADARQLESNGHNVTYILVVTNLYIEIYRLFHCLARIYWGNNTEKKTFYWLTSRQF